MQRHIFLLNTRLWKDRSGSGCWEQKIINYNRTTICYRSTPCWWLLILAVRLFISILTTLTSFLTSYILCRLRKVLHFQRLVSLLLRQFCIFNGRESQGVTSLNCVKSAEMTLFILLCWIHPEKGQTNFSISECELFIGSFWGVNFGNHGETRLGRHLYRRRILEPMHLHIVCQD